MKQKNIKQMTTKEGKNSLPITPKLRDLKCKHNNNDSVNPVKTIGLKKIRYIYAGNANLPDKNGY
jgi:hypothetical protein